MTSKTGIDLAECAREAIHVPGSIQPHGVLIVLVENDLSIAHISANIAHFTDYSAETLVGSPLATIFGSRQAGSFEAALRVGDKPGVNPVRLYLERGGTRWSFESIVHRNGGVIIVELEPLLDRNEVPSVDVFALVRTRLAIMEATADVGTLIRFTAADIAQISGFDRAMVYRFEEDWHGTIVAEATSTGIAAKYLGLHFPASDIPEQARALYLKNPLRLIPDTLYVPAALVPDCDRSGRPVDLSRAILRSVSPIHLEYLRNMEVRATLTISIVLDGRLWGLISCHHHRPRHLDYRTRAVCELLGHVLAWQIGSRMERSRLQRQLRTDATINAFTACLRSQHDLSAGLVAGARHLLSAFGAQGFVARLGGTLTRFGATPADDEIIERIATALRSKVRDGVATSRELSELVPDAARVAACASGALMMALSENGDDFILCLRAEVVQTIPWGGDMQTKVTQEGGRLRPRTSFARWIQTVSGRSLDWQKHDAETARIVRVRMRERAQAIEQRSAEEQILFMAHHDSLTRLPNRASFHEILARALKEADLSGCMVGVFFIDLDRFKLFNDEFGHAAGDRILQAAAARMQACLRYDNVVARIGGDEFVAVSPNLASECDAEAIAEKLVNEISEPIHAVSLSDIQLTASVGFAIYPNDAPDAQTLLQYADQAMYRIKDEGRNGFRRFDLSGTGPTYERLTHERRIADGLARGEFIPYYQPIVSLVSGAIVAMETLARWDHPERGILAPAEFITLAEESRLIVSLGDAMLKAACRQCAFWRTLPGRAHLGVSVNVSARQFRETGFLKSVRETLSQTGLVPDALHLELTESMLVGDEQYAMRTLRELANAGISIAIDDFGTGYSSLSYLKRLPVSALKIDQSFIRDVALVPDDTAIVRAIIAMARSLKLTVIAEGVETPQPLAFLRREGCDQVQGFLTGVPQGMAEATALLRAVGSGYGVSQQIEVAAELM